MDTNMIMFIEQTMRATQSQITLNSHKIHQLERDLFFNYKLNDKEYRQLQSLRRNQKALKRSMGYWKYLNRYNHNYNHNISFMKHMKHMKPVIDEASLSFDKYFES